MFNKDKTDYSKPSLLLGEPVGLFDTVNKRYPEIWKIYKTVKSLDWDENEFDYSSCLSDFKNCDSNTREMMIKTLAWQWEADSIASRISPIAGIFATSSELWAAWQRISDQECLTDNHEVYVQDKGWVNIDKINVGDFVIQYNFNKTLEFVKVTHTISKPYTGTVHTFSNRYLLQETTPNHRIPVYMKYATKPAHKFLLASEIPNSGSTFFLNTGELVNETAKTFSDMDRLWVAFQADGSYSSERYTGKRGGVIPITFTFKKDRKKVAMRELLTKLGLEFNEYDLGRCGYTKIYVKVPVSEIRKDGKDFKWVNISKVDHQWCKDFISELHKWDGCDRSKRNGKCIVTYSTTSEACKNIVRDVATFAGYSAYVYETPAKNNRVLCYQVTVTDKSDTATNSINKTERSFNGVVHCITVDSGAFLTKNGDRISVTGNCVHAATYSEIVRNSFDNPNEILDEVLSVKESFDRLDTVEQTLKQSAKAAFEYAAGIRANDQELYDHAFMFAVSMFLLERIQFMASFAVTFAIVDTGLFQPIGKAVQKIAQDEFETHVDLDKAVLRNEMKTERGQLAFERNKIRINKMINEVVNSEINWINYLFSEGRQLVGMNAALLKDWMLFCAKDVYKFFDLEPEHKLPAKNPLKFMENWLDISRIQASPQEQDNAQYKVGILRNDDAGEEFDIDF